jgi:DNA-binding NtrC family response regulator
MKPRILVVDDDEAITQQLYWTLAGEYDVVTANDMSTAIRRATFYKPDISILDLQMPPDGDSPKVGLQLLEFIKGHLPNSRVLIMSSNAELDVQKACYNAGADEFFDKPLNSGCCQYLQIGARSQVEPLSNSLKHRSYTKRRFTREMNPTSSDGDRQASVRSLPELRPYF